MEATDGSKCMHKVDTFLTYLHEGEATQVISKTLQKVTFLDTQLSRYLFGS